METIEQKIERLEEKVNEIFISVEKTRKYFYWTMIATIALFVIPLILMIFVLPQFMSNYLGGLQGLI